VKAAHLVRLSTRQEQNRAWIVKAVDPVASFQQEPWAMDLYLVAIVVQVDFKI
jgi:hypothetical protein